MEEGCEPLPLKRSINLSLQIIITILTIIKLYLNFHESLKYSISLIIDIVFNFLILILVNIIPFASYYGSEEIFTGLGYTLANCWALNIFSGNFAFSTFESEDFKGIYNFILYGRIVLIPAFVACFER